MRRAEALRPLSREHLVALSVAKALREGVDLDGSRRAFLDFWDPAGREHFRREEEVLLPFWALQADVEPAVVRRMAEEHLRLRVAALRIEADDVSLPELARIGDELRDHVRFEERRLFPLIEADLDVGGLEELGHALTE